ncbi:hypothetical protein AB0A72_19820 [Streptosporangium roseum]|nr:hypothetical protein [Streptosporangium roseum]
MAGASVHVVAARPGHADPSITLRVYAHVIRAIEKREPSGPLRNYGRSTARSGRRTRPPDPIRGPCSQKCCLGMSYRSAQPCQECSAGPGS